MTIEAAVTVLLASHNNSATIHQALAGIDAQELAGPFPVVVADDASTDDTREHIRTWAAAHDRLCCFLPHQHHLGISANYKRGFEACHTRYIATLEGDDVWIDPKRLARMVDFLDRHPECPLAFNRLLVVDERYGTSWIQPTDADDFVETLFTAEELAERNIIGNFSACVYRRDAVRRLHWPRLVAAGTRDWLLNMVLADEGPIGMLPQVMNAYRLRATGAWSRLSARETAECTLDAIDKSIPLVKPSVAEALERHRLALQGRVSQLSDAAVPNGVPTTLRILPSRRPLVSVVMPAHNHESYVEEAIASVLEQDVDDLELIIVDDGSTDGTPGLVDAHWEPRLRLMRLRENFGAPSALNLGLQQVRGEYVAIAHSDDTWAAGKLASQLAVLAEEPDVEAVFTDASPVDAAGSPFPVDAPNPYQGLFRQPDRSRGGWLRRLFDQGNCLCHPSLLARRSLCERLGPYDNRLRQLPDFAMWIRLCKQTQLRVIDEIYVYHRRIGMEGNTSSPTMQNWARTLHEFTWIARTFFDEIFDADLRDGFGDLMRNLQPASNDERTCEHVWLLLTAPSFYANIFRLVGVEKLHALLDRKETRGILSDYYGLDNHALHRFTGEATILASGWRAWGAPPDSG